MYPPLFVFLWIYMYIVYLNSEPQQTEYVSDVSISLCIFLETKEYWLRGQSQLYVYQISVRGKRKVLMY